MADSMHPVNQAWHRVTTARNEFFGFQEALLEIASPSKVEGIELDARKRLATKLVAGLGHPEVSNNDSLRIFDSAAAVLSKLGLSRETQPEASSSEVSEFLENEVENLQNLLESGGMSKDLLPQCVSLYMNLVSRVHPRSSIMLESSLISAVSSFESFISRMISASLKFDASPLRSNERKFEYKDIVGFASIDEFVQDAADKFTDNLMRDPLEKWVTFLGNAIRQSNLTWINDELNEILQRRHVHVHNGGQVSRAYLDNISNPTVQPHLHDHLPVSIEYLGDALDKMAGIVLFLSQAAMLSIRESRQAKEIAFDGSDTSTNQIAYDLLVDGRYGAIAKMFKLMDPLFWTAQTREYFRANCWQARKKLFGLGSIRNEISAWDVSLSPMTELAKYSILEDIPKAQPILDRLLADKDISLIQVATWPILEPFRVASTNSPDLATNGETEATSQS